MAELREMIIIALGEDINSRSGKMTYVIRNCVAMETRDHTLKTAKVLRELKKMERDGLVERLPTSYARQICWGLTGFDHGPTP